MSAVRIVHLSDLHFAGEGRADTAYNQLVSDLRKEQKVTELDAVVVSGDSSDRAQAEDFTAAARFLQKLCDAMGVPPERLLVVPGNHDVDWETSKQAYRPIRRDELPAAPVVSQWQESKSSTYVEVVADADTYGRRFERFGAFHEEVTGRPYPLDYGEQMDVVRSADGSVVLVGLNSGWRCDHYHPGRSSVNDDALNRALDAASAEDDDVVKIAIWHHPLHGDDQLEDDAFVERLVVSGFRVALHGHVHHADEDLFTYEHSSKGRKLHVLGAGTLDSPDPQRGFPWQYSVIDVGEDGAEVRSRGRNHRGGAWRSDARFHMGAGEPPADRLRLDLGSRSRTAARAREPEPTPAPELPEVVRFMLLLAECVYLAYHARSGWATVGERQRSLRLVSQHHPRLAHDAMRLGPQLDEARPGLAAEVQSFVNQSLPPYLDVTDLHLRFLPGFKDNEDFQDKRKRTWYVFDGKWLGLEDVLKATPVFAIALAEQEARGDAWSLLGFKSKLDYTEYLQPTMRSLRESPGELEEHVLERLLHRPLNVKELEEEGMPESIVVDLLNRLLADKWAKMDDDDVSLTPAGQDLLKKRLDSWRARSS